MASKPATSVACHETQIKDQDKIKNPFVDKLSNNCQIIDGDAHLELRVVSPDLEVRWFRSSPYKVVEPLKSGGRYMITSFGCVRKLVIGQIKPVDNNMTVTAICNKKVTQAKIVCNNPEAGFLEKLPDKVNIKEGDTVKLTCKVSDARLKVEWFGFNPDYFCGWAPIHADNERYHVISVGMVRGLIIKDYKRIDAVKLACAVGDGLDISNCELIVEMDEEKTKRDEKMVKTLEKVLQKFDLEKTQQQSESTSSKSKKTSKSTKKSA